MSIRNITTPLQSIYNKAPVFHVFVWLFICFSKKVFSFNYHSQIALSPLLCFPNPTYLTILAPLFPPHFIAVHSIFPFVTTIPFLWLLTNFLTSVGLSNETWMSNYSKLTCTNERRNMFFVRLHLFKKSYLHWKCWTQSSTRHQPSITKVCCRCCLSTSRNWKEDLVAEVITYMVHILCSNEPAIHLEVSSLPDRLHSSGSCYTCYWEK